MEYRNTQSVLLEAIVIGIMTVMLYSLLKFLPLKHILVLFLTGFLIHILFEYTGGNEWWCKNTYK